MLKKLVLIFLLLGTSNLLFSQITISSPVLRQVFQRDLNNQATVTITGSYSQPVDTIQVRFLTVATGQGTPIDWTVIKSAPLGGLFKGSVNVKGGWYTMEVRGLLGGKIVGSVSSLSRVGVGEVFVIAGQSNAGGSGERGVNETGANDDRVNCANFSNVDRNALIGVNFDGFDPTYKGPIISKDATDFSLIEFAKLEKTSSIGPRGFGPYYWAKVGDALVAKLGVPILFFNTGWGGASARVWAESAQYPNGKLVNGKLVGPESDAVSGIYYDIGTPYKNLNAVLRYYGVNLGVRAVLWMQGETENVLNLDNDPNNNITIDQYKNNLEFLLKQTRQDFGNSKLPWVIARTSYSGQLGCGTNTNDVQKPSPIIVNAQNQTISNALNAPVYPGPFSDNIQIPRLSTGKANCVHFKDIGLTDVATAWVKSLTEDNKSFFETVEPIIADTIPSISLDCISSSQLKLSLPDGYAGYEWVSTDNGTVVGKTKSVNVPTGGYIARVTRSNGNIIQVPRFNVKANAPAKAPIVTATSDVNFCLGTSVLLQSSTEADNPIYEWTSSPAIGNLPRTKDIAASREATYKLRVIDKNACASPYSADVKLVAKPRPEKPTIATSGSTEFCDGQSIVLTSSNVGASSYLWSGGENTQAITVKKGGSYSVQTRAGNGCLSQSSTDNISVIVNPLPATPQIRALADTVFCEGGSVTLISTPSDNSTKFGWNRNNVDDKTALASTIKVFGTELVKGFVIDNKNCNSKLSNAIQVVKKDNPKVVTVVQKGTYTLAARADKPADEYTWKFNDKVLTSKDTVIRATEDGKYSVIGKNVYKVKSTTTPLTCLSAESSFSLVSYDDKGLSVYPNPSNGRFILESRYDLDKVGITIYTMDGKLIQEGKIELLNTQRVLDLSGLREGTYILRVESNSFKISKLINIER
jgi:Secretion system C-terminal sorting domain/Carbohydrate esterase, sialic acid-specific acetylesterase